MHAKKDYALRLASMNRRLDVVKYLISVGANVTDNALCLASYYGFLDIVKFLVNFYNFIPLDAIEKAKNKVVKNFLKEINKQNEQRKEAFKNCMHQIESNLQ